VVHLRAYLLAALLLGTTLALASPAAALQCYAPTDPSLVGQVRSHVAQQCNAVIDAIYHGNVVRDLLDVVDATCVFVTGSTCVP
jgi:hypothetical protein